MNGAKERLSRTSIVLVHMGSFFQALEAHAAKPAMCPLAKMARRRVYPIGLLSDMWDCRRYFGLEAVISV